MSIPNYDQEIEKHSPSFVDRFITTQDEFEQEYHKEDEEECEHMADDYVLNENGESFCSKCHPELLKNN